MKQTCKICKESKPATNEYFYKYVNCSGFEKTCIECRRKRQNKMAAKRRARNLEKTKENYKPVSVDKRRKYNRPNNGYKKEDIMEFEYYHFKDSKEFKDFRKTVLDFIEKKGEVKISTFPEEIKKHRWLQDALEDLAFDKITKIDGVITKYRFGNTSFVKVEPIQYRNYQVKK